MNYKIYVGTVQCYVAGPCFFKHFGRAEYDRNKPVLSQRLQEQAQPIVDALNAGLITHEAANIKLDLI